MSRNLYKNTKKLVTLLGAVIVITGVAYLGVKFLFSGRAATGFAVPIPVNSYVGFDDNTYQDTPSVAPSSCRQGGQTGIECEITWAAKQQGIAFPYAAGADGYLYHPAWHQFYKECSQVTSSLKAGTGDYNMATKPGRKMLMINTKCGMPNDITSGNRDADIKAMVDVLDKLPVPVIIAYHHEPENDGCSSTLNPDNYRAAYRRFASVIRAEETKNGKHNIDIGWILMGVTFNKNSSAIFKSCATLSSSNPSNSNEYRNPDNWYPGDDIIDWVGSDPYNGDTFTAEMKPFNDWGACRSSHPTTDFNCSSSRINKPKYVAEFGYGLGQNAHPADATATWIDGMRTALKSGAMPHIKAYTWYKKINTTGSGGAVWDPNFLQAKALARWSFDPAIAIPRFSGSGGSGGGSGGGATTDTTKPDVKWSSPTGGSTVSGTITIAANATDNVGVTNVSFLVDDAIKGSDATSPYSLSYDTRNLTNGAHIFQARAVDAAGNVALTGKVTLTISNSTVDTTPPSRPTNITSTSQTTNSISLSWSPSTDNISSSAQIKYQVSRNGTALTTTSAGSTVYTDSGLAPATTYSYTLVAIDTAGNRSSASAAFTKATKSLNCAKPTAPTTFTSNSTTTAVVLAWSAVAAPSGCSIKNYVVQRAGVTIASPNSTTYTATGLTPSTKYSFTVFAVTNDNTAGTSTTKNATTKAAVDTTPPSAPSSLTASVVSTNQINLSWKASADNESSIKIYHIMRAGKEIATSTTTNFGDSGLKASTSYSYQIVAENGAGLKASSATVSAKTLAEPPVPPTNGGGGGSGSGSTPTPTTGSTAKPPVIPALNGTTSVGSGTDTGIPDQQVTDNPTIEDAVTDDPAAQPVPKAIITPPSESKHTFALVSSIAGGVLLIAAIAAVALWRRHILRLNRLPVMNDPDLKIKVMPSKPVIDPDDLDNKNNLYHS